MVSDLQEEFERILINHGLLKEGIDAAADELGRSVSQESKAAAQQFRKQTSEYVIFLIFLKSWIH